jgi:transposase
LPPYEAARPGIEVVNLPGYSPDLNPIKRLWDWMREDVRAGSATPAWQS